MSCKKIKKTLILSHAAVCFVYCLNYLCVLYCRECYQLKRKKVKILGLGAFFALTLVAMEQNQKTLVRLSKQNKTREEHKKVSICSAKKGKHTCRVCIVQNGVFVIVMIGCGFLFWREQSNLIDKGQIWSSCLQIHQPYTECTDSKARSCHISSVADTQDLKGYRYSCGAVIIAADLPVCLTASFASLLALHVLLIMSRITKQSCLCNAVFSRNYIKKKSTAFGTD